MKLYSFAAVLASYLTVATIVDLAALDGRTTMFLMEQAQQDLQGLDTDGVVNYLTQKLQQGHSALCHLGLHLKIAECMFAADQPEPRQAFVRVVEAMATNGLTFYGYEGDSELHYMLWASVIWSGRASFANLLIRQGLQVVGANFDALELIQAAHDLDPEFVQELIGIHEITALGSQGHN